MADKRLVSVLCALMMMMVGCGSSDDEGAAPVAGLGGAGGTSGVGGGGGAGGAMTVQPLPSDTAGKPCAANTECAPGTCTLMVEGVDGMPAPAPGGYCTGDCATDVDCGAGGTCVLAFGTMAGLCYDSCTADTECREGYVCGPLTGTCRPAPATDQLADNSAGIACAADPECGDGTCLTTLLSGEPFPGGYCSGACLMDSHCGAGGVCWRTGAAAGRCYDACTIDTDCTRDGYRCRVIADPIMGCLPAADPLPDNTTGLACAGDAECGGVMGACAAMLPAAGGGEVAAPAGYCTTACEIDADCGAGGLCVVTREGARCFDPCAVPTDCREGYVCGERGGGEMPSIVCTPIEPIENPDAAVPMPDAGP